MLVEGISVIIRAERLLEAFGGNWDRFKSLVPNDTLCADGELVRVGFLSPSETEEFCNALERTGLVFRDDAGDSRDFTVCDQQKGMTIPTDWATFGHTKWQGDAAKMVAGCQLVGSASKQLFTPDGWTFDQSLTENFLFFQTQTRPK